MIRKILMILYVLFLFQFGCYQNEVKNDAIESAKNTKILASASSLEEAQAIALEHGLKITTTYHAISSVKKRWYGVFEQNTSTKRYAGSVISDIKQKRGEIIAEPDHKAKLFAVPNDPAFSKLWGLKDSSGVDIDADLAWNINKGSHDVIVGVIDSGLNYNHPDLTANVWVNHGEIPGNGIDDDRNGYVDDIHGINSITNSGDPNDDHGHGTHVSGTIGAVGNNGIGITGVCWNVKIMGLKFLNRAANAGDASNAIKCIDYAIDQKLKGQNIVALNNSWGDLPFNQVFTDAVEACKDVGIIFVAASGNGSTDHIGDDNDKRPVYPASFDFPHVVAVAATSDLNKLCKFSNYGLTSVDIGAPGIGIYSTKLKNTYGLKNGTSMAAPHVTGAIALLASEYPEDNYLTRIEKIFDNVDKVPALNGKVKTGGRLNVYKALMSGSTDRLKANFSYDIYQNDLSANFTDQSTSTSSYIVRWAWDFGDGNYSSLQHVTHIYEKAGTYTVKLTVEDDRNRTDSLLRKVVIINDDGVGNGDDDNDDDDNDDDNSGGCN